MRTLARGWLRDAKDVRLIMEENYPADPREAPSITIRRAPEMTGLQSRPIVQRAVEKAHVTAEPVQ